MHAAPVLTAFSVPEPLMATALLAVHLLVIAFNVIGLAVVPIGVWRRWAWVRAPLWRIVHALSLAIVAVQALLGRACILTLWQERLQGRATAVPMIQQWVDRLVYWPLPMAFFTVLYVLVFIAVLLLWWRWPPRRDWRVLKR